MNGCHGDASKSGPYVTGECPTIELALKELQIHIDTYHEHDLKKTLKCSVPNCDFETEFLPNKAGVECLKMHVNLHHQVKEEAKYGAKAEGEAKSAVFKAVKCNVIFKKGQSFESFEKEVQKWREATKGLADHARDVLFSEAISNAEDIDVKEFYTRNIMNNESIQKTTDDILKKLKEKFGKTEKQKWDEVFERISSFSFGMNDAKKAWDEIEIDRYNAKDVWKSEDGVDNPEANCLLDKLFIRKFISKGSAEKKFEKSLIPKLEEDIQNCRYDWDESKAILKKYIFDYIDKDEVNTHFVRRNSTRGANEYERRRSRSRSFQRGSYERNSYRDGSRGKRWNRSNSRNRTSTPMNKEETKTKSTLELKVEKMDSRMESVEKLMKKIVEQLNSSTTLNNTHFVNDLNVSPEIKTFLAHAGTSGALIDSGSPKTVSSERFIKKYMKDHDLSEEHVSRRSVDESFKFGPSKTFPCKEIVELPIHLQDEDGKRVIEEIGVHIVEAEIPFLLGMESLEERGAVIDIADNTVTFKKSGNKFRMRKTLGGHGFLDFIKPKREIFINFDAKNEDHLREYKKVRNVHRLSGHKLNKNMIHMYKRAKKKNALTPKIISEVIKRCKTCQKKKKSNPRPKLSIMKAKSPNDIVTLDLKQFNRKGKIFQVLWMIDAFSRMAIGSVLKSKEGTEVVKAIERAWIFVFGCPTTGFWADNGTEFQNQHLRELCQKWKKTLSFGAPYSPWSNGINERNHASCDIVVEKLLDEDPNLTVEDAVIKAQWTHNTNINKEGFVPLQILTGKAVTYPGLDVREDGKEVSDHVREMLNAQNTFRENEFKKKIEEAETRKVPSYVDETYDVGENVLYQDKNEKEWKPGIVVDPKTSGITIETESGNKRIHPSKVQKRFEEVEDIDCINDNENEKSTPSCQRMTRSMSRVKFDDKIEDNFYVIEEDHKKFIELRKKHEKQEHNDIYMANLENNDDNIDSIFVVEIPVRQHGRDDVKEAKANEIKNLEQYDVFETVEDEGQNCIGTRWVFTEKEDHDGQKTKVKARLVAKGFQEKEKIQSDSPTAQKESLKLFLAVAALQNIDKVRSLDIAAAFLQADVLKRDIFVEPPKDIKEEGVVWKLRKPLYGLNDAGRRFWLRVKKLLKENGYESIKGDEAFYVKRKQGVFAGMLLLHVDDFLMAGSESFVKETTDMFESNLEISKIEDNCFRFVGLDLKKSDENIEVSMEDYVGAIEEVPMRQGKKKDLLTAEEMTLFRKITGKIAWLASNCRPDLSYNALQLSMKGKDATLEDMKYANHVIKKAKNKNSKVTYKLCSKAESLVVYGLSDASYKAGEKAIGGQFLLIGNTDEVVMPIFWRSKLIKKVCKSPKDAETINLGIVADLSRHAANQLEQIVGKESRNKNIAVKVFTDSLGTLESIASSHQVERRMMRADIAYLKQKLEEKKVDKYCWIQDKRMIADLLTKEKKEKFGVEDLIRDNRLDVVKNEDNCVEFKNDEFEITGRKLRDKILPAPKVPRRKKIKTKKEEEKKNPGEYQQST